MGGISFDGVGSDRNPFGFVWISRIYPSRDRNSATAGKDAGRAASPDPRDRSHAQPAPGQASMARTHALPDKADAVADFPVRLSSVFSFNFQDLR